MTVYRVLLHAALLVLLFIGINMAIRIPATYFFGGGDVGAEYSNLVEGAPYVIMELFTIVMSLRMAIRRRWALFITYVVGLLVIAGFYAFIE